MSDKVSPSLTQKIPTVIHAQSATVTTQSIMTEIRGNMTIEKCMAITCLPLTLTTPVMPQKLRPLLGAHPDSELYAKVLTNGFFLSYQGEHCELISRNSISISKNLDIAEQKIAEEVKLGIIAGPYPSPSKL